MAFGIHNRNADISSISGSSERKASSERKLMKLRSDETFYQEIRDLHINKLGPLLQQKAVSIQETYKEKDTMKSAGAGEMVAYVKKFKSAQAEHPLLEMHA